MANELLPHHLEHLRASAIADEVIEARGYRSIDADEAQQMGWVGIHARAGLLIPSHQADGFKGLGQLRPDDPPLNEKGKPIKYLSLKGQRNVLDVPPTMREELLKGRRVWFITEGTKKADALASMGLPAISLSGVENWRGDNGQGGKTALPDWNDINIKGSKIVIAYDSDAWDKKEVWQATSKLKDYLEYRQADSVGVLVIPSNGIDKVGVDDYLASLGSMSVEEKQQTLAKLVSWEMPPPPLTDEQTKDAAPDADRLLRQFVRPEDWLDEPEPHIPWIVQDMLAEGSFTMLSAYPKEGKSTFARQLSLAVARGEGFLDKATARGTVLYFALEEMERDVRAKFRALGIQKGDPLLIRHHAGYPSIVDDLKVLVERERPRLIVIDTLVRLPKPKFDMADYFAVSEWLNPLLNLAHEYDSTILVVYHSNKAGRGVEGADAITTIMGSTALGAMIDQLIYITQSNEGIRAYGTIGRFPSIPPTLMSFDEGTQRLEVIGEKSEVKRLQEREELLENVSSETWMTREEIQDLVGIRNDALGTHLKALVTDGWFETKKGGSTGRKSLYRQLTQGFPNSHPIQESGNPSVKEVESEVQQPSDGKMGWLNAEPELEEEWTIS